MFINTGTRYFIGCDVRYAVLKYLGTCRQPIYCASLVVLRRSLLPLRSAINKYSRRREYKYSRHVTTGAVTPYAAFFSGNSAGYDDRRELRMKQFRHLVSPRGDHGATMGRRPISQQRVQLDPLVGPQFRIAL